ncbi:D-alanyl-D-alanine carboxypeptidase/D-alanyl-D-alanine-endopeptidase [Oceanidesulfovibrio marinus]|nr:D-alanyl-D-alanine carboxypeptidase/D-alanyl-D-alanine-endopeptidase [Oceanidesulfovibrio marinus]
MRTLPVRNPVCLVFFLLILLAAGPARAQQGTVQAAVAPAPAPGNYHAAASDADALRVELLSIVTDPKLTRAHTGLYVKDLSTGQVLLDRNSELLFIPASTLKLFTTAAAISLLGPSYTYKTPLLLDGVVEGDTLHGNLVVRGSGDPSISGVFHGDKPLTVFTAWAQQLRQRGIQRISGDLIGDASLFPGPPLGMGWNWDDESYWYAAQTGALAFNESTADVSVTADGKPGDPVGYEVEPVAGYLNVDNEAVVGAPKSGSSFVAERRHGENVLAMTGELPRGSRTGFACTVEGPADWFLFALRSVLEANGVYVVGQSRVVTDPRETTGWSNATQAAVYTSPPVSELVTFTNRKSHNFYAEQLLKTIGATRRNLGTARAGAEAVMSWASGLGVNRKGLEMVDGSGLSRMNLVSPRAMVALLEGMRGSGNFQAFYDSMPVAGCHGSLTNRMCNTPAEDVAHAKVGFVTHDICLAGYTRDKRGGWYAYALFVNNHTGPVRDAKAMQDAVVAALSAVE